MWEKPYISSFTIWHHCPKATFRLTLHADDHVGALVQTDIPGRTMWCVNGGNTTGCINLINKAMTAKKEGMCELNKSTGFGLKQTWVLFIVLQPTLFLCDFKQVALPLWVSVTSLCHVGYNIPKIQGKKNETRCTKCLAEVRWKVSLMTLFKIVITSLLPLLVIPLTWLNFSFFFNIAPYHLFIFKDIYFFIILFAESLLTSGSFRREGNFVLFTGEFQDSRTMSDTS